MHRMHRAGPHSVAVIRIAFTRDFHLVKWSNCSEARLRMKHANRWVSSSRIREVRVKKNEFRLAVGHHGAFFGANDCVKSIIRGSEISKLVVSSMDWLSRCCLVPLLMQPLQDQGVGNADLRPRDGWLRLMKRIYPKCRNLAVKRREICTTHSRGNNSCCLRR
jgi:hypothetical protein